MYSVMYTWFICDLRPKPTFAFYCFIKTTSGGCQKKIKANLTLLPLQRYNLHCSFPLPLHYRTIFTVPAVLPYTSAAQSQITVTGKSIILQEKLKTNVFLYMKYGITCAVDAAVYVFMLVYCFKLHMNCRSVWKVFVKRFGRVIWLCFGVVLLFTLNLKCNGKAQ